MAQHAVLSPSSSARWLTCTGSLRVIEEVYPDGVPDQTSEYAEEGTRAHTVAEWYARDRFGLDNSEAPDVDYKDDDELDEMIEHAQFYVSVLEQITAEAVLDDPKVYIEKRVFTGIEGVWGTADALIHFDTELVVVDYKYGRGVQVASEDNTQLKLYGLGGLRFFQENHHPAEGQLTDHRQIDTVKMIVVQPRSGTPVSEFTMTVEDLEDWGRTVAAPKAAEALAREGEVIPSEEACRWCPAAGACAVRAEKMLREDFGTEPEKLTPTELGEILQRLADIESWTKAVREYALYTAYDEGTKIPGFKSIWKDGSRKIVDPEAAIKALMAKRFRKGEVSRTVPETLGKLDKLVGGKDKLADILGDALTVGEGKPTIVPEDHTAPEFTKADKAGEEFGDVDIDEDDLI